MSYAEFLGRWYNLVFLGIGTAGLGFAAWGKLAGRDVLRPATGLLATSVVGLTWNGAVHDLGLGSPALRFPLILLVSAGVGVLLAHGAGRLRDRYFPPITSVRFNRPGLEGARARIVTREVGPVPGSGRAQWQDPDGVLHIVHAHTDGEGMGFGRRVVLGTFDPEAESYLVRPLSKTDM